MAGSTRVGGRPLDSELRTWLETAYGADLGAVRVHTGTRARATTRLLGAEAFTFGNDVVVGSATRGASFRHLIAHEVAHVLQQRAGNPGAARPLIGQSGDPWEAAADRAASWATAGHVRVPVLPQDVGEPPCLQLHDSFEHRALGDLGTDDIRSVMGSGSARAEVIQLQIQLLWLWHQNPEAVTEEQVAEQCPWIRTTRLRASGLLVTYGEINALPDYLPTPQSVDATGKEVLLPILQYIRQEGYIRLNGLLNRTVTDSFQGSVFSPSSWMPGLLSRLLESKALDDLTLHLGVEGTDHYSALLARNACHFAPFSWYRWEASHTIARSLAQQAHETSDSARRAELTHEAWVHHGYADHFLQDSFAAGHLVDKTQIMQWFVDWATNQPLVPVADWDRVRLMSSALQPGLAGKALYAPDWAGGSNDPQTAEDQPTYPVRRATTQVVPGGSPDLGEAYQDYLAFLSSLITQSASAAIHDHWNTNSLWVASANHPEPFEVYGDDTLFSGSGGASGAEITSESAQESQAALREILETGDTGITVAQLRASFPTMVRGSSGMLSLPDWNDTQQAFCAETIFPGLHDIIVRVASPTIGNVSVDQDLATRWYTSLPSAGYDPTSVLSVAGRVFAGSNGYVYEVDARTGAVLHQLRVSDAAGVGDYDTRLACDGSTLFVGVHGYVYGVALNDWSRPRWTASLPKAGYTVVELLTASARLYAGSNGRFFELNASTGAVVHSVNLASMFGSGDYRPSLVLANPSTLVVGMHGYVYAINTGSFSGSTWDCSLPNGGYHPVDVAMRDGRLFAGSNGYVYELKPDNGSVVHQLLVTDSVGVGDYTTTVAVDGLTLFAGVHGYVYGVRLGDFSRAAWSTDLVANRYSSVHLSAFDGQLIAGSYGYLYRIDPHDGRLVRSALLASSVGVGDYETRLAQGTDPSRLLVGAHGYAYAAGLTL